MKRTSKILSIIFSVSLLLGNCTIAFADSTTYLDNSITLYDDGETKVSSYEDENGNIILSQYIDGKLVQVNEINPSNPRVISRQFYGSGQSTANSAIHDEINIDDFGTLATHAARAKEYVGHFSAGTINYRGIIDTGYVYYSLRCSFDLYTFDSSTYTVNSYYGSLINLISIFIAAFNLPQAIAAHYVGRLLVGLGIGIAAGHVTSAVSATVSCSKVEYAWTITNTSDAGNSKQVYGYKYHITDDESNLEGNTYYESPTPQDWETQELAILFHDQMFSYPAWEVISWT